MSHHYSLKWTNHPCNISTVFSRLRQEQLFTDVTLATSDRQTILAHRVVLSAGSLYLEKILGINPSDHPTLVFTNIKYRELKLIIDFMYTGEISVDQPLLPTLLEAAAHLQVKGLYEKRVDNSSSLEDANSVNQLINDSGPEMTSSPEPELTVTPQQKSQSHLMAIDKVLEQPQRQLQQPEPYEPSPKKRKRSLKDHQSLTDQQQHTDTHQTGVDLNHPKIPYTPGTTNDTLPAKSVVGCANTGWLINASKESVDKEDSVAITSANTTPAKDECSKDDLHLYQNGKDDIPSLLSLAADRQNLFNQLKQESKSSVQESLLQQAAAMYTNPNVHSHLSPQQAQQMVQAMAQSTYLSQLAALQQHSTAAAAFQSSATAQFHGSFTTFAAANNAISSNQQSPFKFTGMLNSAPVRRYKQYTETTLQAALKEIMEGQSINRSSMKHNIPARTLRDWMKRLNIKSVYTHNKDSSSSVGSNSPEPDLNVSLERLKSVFSSGNDEDGERNQLKIDESGSELNSAPMVA